MINIGIAGLGNRFVVLASALCAIAGMSYASPAISASVADPASVRPPSVQIEIRSRTSAFDGATFGEHGDYEEITGIAHLAVDPLAPANRGIVDLRYAPRDRAGLVRYDVDFAILRPRIASQARRIMLYDVVNRGSRMVPSLNRGSMDQSFLMRQGYTLVWSGWQGDLSAPKLIGARFPVATRKGRPITGPISIEASFGGAGVHRVALPYPAAVLDPSRGHLTVQKSADSPVQPVPAAHWTFQDATHISITPVAGMDAGAIYRFTYVARDPRVMGLGFAAVRDFVDFLRHGSTAQGNPLADIADAPCERTTTGECAGTKGDVFDTAIAYGASQSGRYLRDFLWQGFNRSINGGRVFDGMIPFVAGARRTFTNRRFAEPGRFSRQHEDHDVPGFDFPFTYGALADPVTGRRDAILARCTRSETCPRIFHIDTSAEFWQAGASLVGTGGTAHDVAFPANVRAYMIAGGSHAPDVTLPACRYRANPLDYSPVLRALLVAMVDWTADRRKPPESRWPRISADDLRPLATLAPPDLHGAGLDWPAVVNRPVAPAGTAGWPVLVPRVDADGNDVPGIHMPALAAPSGTYLGWSVYKAGVARGDLCNIFGSYLPFAADDAARGADPRLSYSRRYPGDRRNVRMDAAGQALRADGLLLDEDMKQSSRDAR